MECFCTRSHCRGSQKVSCVYSILYLYPTSTRIFVIVFLSLSSIMGQACQLWTLVEVCPNSCHIKHVSIIESSQSSYLIFPHLYLYLSLTRILIAMRRGQACQLSKFVPTLVITRLNHLIIHQRQKQKQKEANNNYSYCLKGKHITITKKSTNTVIENMKPCQ